MKPAGNSGSRKALERVEQLALDNPMPAPLTQQIANWIEPHTMHVEADHADVMDAIKIAFPLIRDYLTEHAGDADTAEA